MERIISNKTFTTLSQVADYYQRRGYNHTVKLDDKDNRAEDWCIAGFHRFEGNSPESVRGLWTP